MFAGALRGATEAPEATEGGFSVGFLSGLLSSCGWGTSSRQSDAGLLHHEIESVIDDDDDDKFVHELSTACDSIEYPFDTFDEELMADNELSLPNFSGRWVLEELQGDFDRWLQEMQPSSWRRMPARRAVYGLGKVVVGCMQSADSFVFVKSLGVAKQRKLTASFTVGEHTEFEEEIGKIAVREVRWDWSCLVLDAKLVDTESSLELRMYLDAHGRFVQEMVSCKGRSIKYIFRSSE